MPFLEEVFASLFGARISGPSRIAAGLRFGFLLWPINGRSSIVMVYLSFSTVVIGNNVIVCGVCCVQVVMIMIRLTLG